MAKLSNNEKVPTIEEVFNLAGLEVDKYVEIDKRYFRPTEVDYLKGDASKAKKLLKWQPKIKFEDLVSEMIKNDINNSSLK